MSHRHVHQSIRALGLAVMLATASMVAAIGDASTMVGHPGVVGTSSDALDIDAVPGGEITAQDPEPGRSGMPTAGEAGIIALTLAFGMLGVMLLRKKSPSEN